MQPHPLLPIFGVVLTQLGSTFLIDAWPSPEGLTNMTGVDGEKNEYMNGVSTENEEIMARVMSSFYGVAA